MRSVHTAGYRAVLEVLIAARQQAGVTQQDLARRLKRPQSFVSKYESGERRLDVAEFIAILAALGADPLDAFAQILETAPSRPRAKKGRKG